MHGPHKIITFYLLIAILQTTDSQTISSNLPLVSINTNGAQIVNEPKITASLSIYNKGKGMNSLSDPPGLTCKIGIEIRGSSSQSFPKKSYGFETWTETGENRNLSLLGLPAENDWVLYAPYNDKTMIRDILAYKFFKDMGHYATRYVLCELFLNNEYHGVYVLLEKIKQDKNRVNITKIEPTGISGMDMTGGYIFKIDKPTGSDNDGWTSSVLSKIQTGRKINFLYHDPSPTDLQHEQKEYIRNYIFDFEKLLASEGYANEKDGYRNQIDLNSFADYFIVNEVSKNIDAYRTSSFFHKDRDDKNGKLVAGPPWDYNLGFGNANYNSGEVVTEWVYQGIPETEGRQIPFWWQRFLNDPVFYSTVKNRYTHFRQNILKTGNVNALIDSFALVLKDPQARNFATWKILGKYTWPNPYIGATYQQEIDYLKKWLNDRLTWIDSNLLILNNPEMDQIAKNSVVVYPNPFQENINIEILPDVGSKRAILEIFDLTGKKLFHDVVHLRDGEKTFYSLNEQWNHIGALSKGAYILSIVHHNGKVFIGKIIKK